MKVSIVVPAFNEERLLGQSLGQIKQAAKAFEQRGWETELIVCDNNSTDRTAEIACEAGATVVFEPINQIARARNCGAAAATGNWLIFVDADSHPSAELFSDVAAQITSGKCLAGGATVKMDGNHPAAAVMVPVWNGISRFFKFPAGSFIFCDAAAFQKIGGFSTQLFAGEELELGKRLQKLAKELKKKIVILNRHPLLTSSRKLKLYSLGEHLRLLFRFAFNREQLANREACHLWYDGRR
ncbi:MAG TPA: glycosyltransferase [Candidatus Acidoferrales bacterium]|nr:glycosyltransferase [Candidatus Acidoferrales bacterium]